jgi:hypothetical protein
MYKNYRLKIEVKDQMQDTFEALRLQRVLPEALAPLSRGKWHQILEDCNPYVRR